jgi:hypothetical protein
MLVRSRKESLWSVNRTGEPVAKRRRLGPCHDLQIQQGKEGDDMPVHLAEQPLGFDLIEWLSSFDTDNVTTTSVKECVPFGLVGGGIIGKFDLADLGLLVIEPRSLGRGHE